MWIQGQTGNSSLTQEGTNKTHFLRERYKYTSNAGINNNLQKETFLIHIHRNIYQNLSGEYLNRYLNKTK